MAMLRSTGAERVIRVAPMVMSVLALALVVEGVAQFGGHRPADEGWQAHLFQLLMVLQVPLIAMFALSGWGSGRTKLPTVGAQVVLWGLALGALRLSGL